MTALQNKTPGTLYLVPAPLDFGCSATTDLTATLPMGTLQTAARLDHWICENAKTARGYLKRIDAIAALATPLQAQSIVELPHAIHKKGDHGGHFDATPLLQPALQGHAMGLLSEAGMPAVADPGSSVVRSAHALGLPVVPLVGPVSLLLALAASGLNGQDFAFVGYLPQTPDERRQRIRELETVALKRGQTQLFIETPYRNSALFNALLTTLQPRTRLAVACGLTLATQRIASATIADWKKRPPSVDSATPCVFLIGR